MISYLQGSILKKTDKGAILKVNDIGYFIHLNNSHLSEITLEQDCEFFLYQHIREDCNDLYGFFKFEEMEFFKQLLTINGIGPKVALEITNIPSNKIKSAIINEDSTFICTIPGIGKKTAQRIILELKNKIDVETLETIEKSPSQQLDDDIVNALINLGYQRKHIFSTLRKMPEDLKNEHEVITYFLKNA